MNKEKFIEEMIECGASHTQSSGKDSFMLGKYEYILTEKGFAIRDIIRNVKMGKLVRDHEAYAPMLRAVKAIECVSSNDAIYSDKWSNFFTYYCSNAACLSKDHQFTVRLMDDGCLWISNKSDYERNLALSEVRITTKDRYVNNDNIALIITYTILGHTGTSVKNVKSDKLDAVLIEITETVRSLATNGVNYDGV